MTNRRSFLLGLGAALAAPAIVRAEFIMPVRKLITELPEAWLPCDGREVSRALYPDLFAVMGAVYGAASAGKFKLPDMGCMVLNTASIRLHPSDGRGSKTWVKATKEPGWYGLPGIMMGVDLGR